MAKPRAGAQARKAAGVYPSMKRVDTCAAEFAAETPYMYSSYDGSCEARPTSRHAAAADSLCGSSCFLPDSESSLLLGGAGPRCSSWEAGPTGLARASSSTTAAAMRPSRCGRHAAVQNVMRAASMKAP